MTSLKTGRYVVIVNAPECCVLSTVMEMDDRRTLDALADVDYLEETLVALAVASATVIAELEKRQTSNADTAQRVPTTEVRA